MATAFQFILLLSYFFSAKCSRQDSCSIDFYGTLFCDIDKIKIDNNVPNDGNQYTEYNVLNTSSNSRIFMIRWGFISNPDIKYTVNNNVIIESFINDAGSFGKPDHQFITNEWNIDGKIIPNNIFPEKESYTSCQTIYLPKNEYIREISYDINNENALIGLKFTSSTSTSYICPPEHNDNEWDYTLSGSKQVYMLNGFSYNIYGNEKIMNTHSGQQTYIKDAVSAGFESISFGNSCNPPCYDSNGGKRNYNSDYFTLSNDNNTEFLIYNSNYKMDFYSASDICSSIGSSLATLHSFNKHAVSSLIDNIWLGTDRHNFWIDDTPILGSSIAPEINIDSSSKGCGYFTRINDTIHYGNCTKHKQFFCNNPSVQHKRINLWIRTCDLWQAAKHKDGQMQIVFKGETAFSKFIVINKNDTLPSDDAGSLNEYDKWELYELYNEVIPNTTSNISEYGQLIQFQLQMDLSQDNLWNFYATNSISFCLSGLVLQFGDNIYSRTSSINRGVILSTKCPSQWILHKTEPYLQCFDNIFEISTLSNNAAQYQVDIHLCSQSSSGISAEDVGKLKMSLTGKSYLEGVQRSTDQVSLSHGDRNKYLLPSILTPVGSQHVFLSGDLLPGGELTKYIVRGSEYRGAIVGPETYAFSPPKDGKILGYYVSYLSSVRFTTDDGEHTDLLFPIMYNMLYQESSSFKSSDRSSWDDIVNHFSIQSNTEIERTVYYWNNVTNQTENDTIRETLYGNSFLAPNDSFMNVYDYRERTKYITNNDNEMYVIFDEAKQVRVFDYFMISMVLPSLSTPWAAYFWSCDTNSPDCPRDTDSEKHWDEFKVAAKVYDYAKIGPIAAISFIYDSNQISQKNLYSFQKTGSNYTHDWVSAGSKCASNDDFSNLASISNGDQMIWAHLELASADIPKDPEPISIRLTNQYELVYTSKHTSSGKHDQVRIAVPIVGTDEYYITMVAHLDTSENPDFGTLVMKGPSDAFAAPLRYVRSWENNKNNCNPDNRGQNNCNIGDYWITWAKPIPPKGYVCLGDVAWGVANNQAKDWSQPASIHDNLFGYRCIKEKYLEKLASKPDSELSVWVSNGVDTDTKGRIYSTQHTLNFKSSFSTQVRYFEFTGNGEGVTRRTEYWNFKSDYIKLYTDSRDDSNDPWIGLRRTLNNDYWLWVDQSNLKSDIITMDDIVYSAGDCAALSNGLLSTTSRTTYYGDRCDNSRDYYLCETVNNGDWNPNQVKSFLMTVGFDVFDEVVLISFENTGDNAICTDKIDVNGESATFISSYWIANTDNNDEECITHSCDTISYALINYPVCAIDVIDTRYDFNDDSQWEEIMNLTAAVSECKNYNRLQTAGCEVSQSIVVTNEEGYELSDGFSYSESRSSGSSNTVEKSTSKKESWSVGIQTEFHFKGASTGSTGETPQAPKTEASGTSKTEASETSETASYHGYLPPRVRRLVLDEFVLGFTGEYGREKEYSTSKTKESWSESGYEENTESSSTNSWSETIEHDVTCVGSIEVAPSHKQMYSLLMNRYRGIVATKTDLKLTLCSSYLDPSNTDNTEHYRYIYNVPSQQYISSITKCVVQFDQPSILLNHLTCDQEQELSFSLGAEYMPTCNETNPSKYDGCQCQIIDSLTSAVCACVDMEGNVLNNNDALVVEGDDWRDTCRELKCDNSIWISQSPTYNPTNSPTFSPTVAPTDCNHDIKSFKMTTVKDKNIKNWEGFNINGNCFHSNYFNYYINDIHPADNRPDLFELDVTLYHLLSDETHWHYKDLDDRYDDIKVEIYDDNNILLDNNRFPAISYILTAETNIDRNVGDTIINLNAHLFYMGYNAFIAHDNSDPSDYCCDKFNDLYNGITFDIFIQNFPFDTKDTNLEIAFEFDLETFWSINLPHYKSSSKDTNDHPALEGGIYGAEDLDDHYNDLFYLYLPKSVNIDGNIKNVISINIKHSENHRSSSQDTSKDTNDHGVSFIKIIVPKFNDFMHFGMLNTERDNSLFGHDYSDAMQNEKLGVLNNDNNDINDNDNDNKFDFIYNISEQTKVIIGTSICIVAALAIFIGIWCCQSKSNYVIYDNVKQENDI